jgi:hypothetical protein
MVVPVAVATARVTASGAERPVSAGPIVARPATAADHRAQVVTLVSGDRVVDGGPGGAEGGRAAAARHTATLRVLDRNGRAGTDYFVSGDDDAGGESVNPFHPSGTVTLGVGTDFVSVRVRVAADNGSSVEQTIIRAYGLTAASNGGG